LIGADADFTNVALSRVLAAIDSRPLRTRQGDINISVTAGYAVRQPGSMQTFEEMILHANQALMAAKNAGKSHVQLAY